jgi:hypothetical protein
MSHKREVFSINNEKTLLKLHYFLRLAAIEQNLSSIVGATTLGFPNMLKIRIFYHPEGCFQSKTLTLKNKNKIFPKFLSPFHITSYGPRTPENERIFGSKLHTPLFIEGMFFYPQKQYEI